MLRAIILALSLLAVTPALALSPAARLIVSTPAPFKPERGGGLAGSFEAAAGVSLNAGAVSSWVDQITAYTVTQGTGAAQPAWSAASCNGGPGLTGDGVDDFLGGGAVPASWPAGSADGMIVALVKIDVPGSTATTYDAFSYGSTATGGQRGVERIGQGGFERARITDTTTNATSSSTNPLLQGYAVIVGRFSGGGSTLSGRINGVEFDTAATGAAFATGTTRARIMAASGSSATRFWPGVVCRIKIVSGVPSVKVQQQLEAWAVWDTYGLQSLLPATHPYRYRRP